MGGTEPGETNRFREFVRRRLGLKFDDVEARLVGEVLEERIRASASKGFDAYWQRLHAPAFERVELRAIAERLTIGETYFFRYPEHFQAFSEAVLPDCVRKHGTTRKLRILSAGCASGEEAYTLAMCIREHLPELWSWKVELVAIDVNLAALRKAARASYSSWSLRETPEYLRSRYWQTQGGQFTLEENVRSMVGFEERNLVLDDPSFWERGRFDVIFCRNVLIYFPQEQIEAAIARMARSLAPGGYLFLGHAENLRGISTSFHLRNTHGTFYYQRKTDQQSSVPPRYTPPPSPSCPVVRVDDTHAGWVDTIGQASGRIAELARHTSAHEPTSHGTAWDLLRVTTLMRDERFDEATQTLDALPKEAASDAQVLILRAALLTNRGELVEAEEACRRVLAVDEQNAGAHYLSALCREHAGDVDNATQHDELAIYLSPDFAMPHLHLGLLARRAGRLQTARRELGEAISLLATEQPSRLVLFGGGFPREALVELCKAELRACGGAR